MNTSKNKKKNTQNKPFNPNPSQNIGSETKTEEKIEIETTVTEKCDVLKSEERVPEILSEVITLPVTEGKEDPDNVGPKKPKRNRGKKKQSEKDDIVETADIKVSETKNPKSLIKEEKNLDDAKMEPTARKKKGKNKASNEPQTEIIAAKVESKVDSMKKDDDVKFNIEDTCEKIEEETKPAAKKKNKKNKKNRTDSEKSDKTEEMSCTSAFQKILQTKSEFSEKKDADNSKTSIVSTFESIAKEIESPKPDDKQKSSEHEVSDLKHEEQVPTAETAKEDLSKNKKKNKKDKKRLSNEGQIEVVKPDIITIVPEAVIQTDEPFQQGADRSPKQTNTKNVAEIINIDTEGDIRDIDTVAKPKANIAKPVDKKGKGKQQVISDTGAELIKTDIPKQEKRENIIEETVNKPKANIVKPVEKKGKGQPAVSEISTEYKNTDIIKPSDISENLTKIDKDQDFGSVCDTKLSVTVNKDKTEIPKIETQVCFDKEYSVLDVFKSSEDKKPSEIVRAKTPEIARARTPDISRAKTPDTSKDQVKKNKPEQLMKIDMEKSNEKTELQQPAVLTLASIEKIKPCQKKGKGKEYVPYLEGQIKLTDVFDSIASKEDKTTELVSCYNIEEPFVVVKPRQKKNKEKHEPLTEEKTKISEIQETVTTPIGVNIEKSENISDIKDPIEVVKSHQKKTKNKNFMPDFDNAVKLPEILEIITKDDANLKIDEPVSSVDIKLDMKVSKQTTHIDEEKVPTPVTTEISSPDCHSKNIEQLLPTLISMTDSISVPDDKICKKRKKSPKPSKKPEKLPPLEESPRSDGDKILQEKTEIPSQIPSISESISGGDSELVIGINPIMTQSTGSEITPDLIEYPRSTSAEIKDDNNNMMIHEVDIPESVLNMPVLIPDTPFIQSSGENLLSSSIVIATCEVVDEIEIKTDASKGPNKKTDLKSQVMEVNKDMEELRMSIERSLAEFSAMEKKEEEVENKYEDSHPKSIDNQSQETLKSETMVETKKPLELVIDPKIIDPLKEQETTPSEPPVCPARKDNKGKNKSKKKGKQESGIQSVSTTDAGSTTSKSENKDSQEIKKDEKSDQKDDSKCTDEKANARKQSDTAEEESKNSESKPIQELLQDFDPIDNFEDALTSSVDDVNKTFEVIAEEALNDNVIILNADQAANFRENPEINITEPDEKDKTKEEKQQRENPLVSQPKNLLGHPVIPARSNKTDYKKEKNKTPNTKIARVKIKDSDDIDKGVKQSKECQTESKPKFLKNKGINESVTCVTSENDEYVYKYSFRRVFLSSNCHVCKKELKDFRVPCNFCHLTFYCSQKHRDEDYAQHQALCFAVSTIVHLKGLKHIYADTAGVIGHNYRLLRMQTIVSCERILKRRLLPWEQEALLYPRVCADGSCREWRQGKLTDCEDCGQIAYCIDNPAHCPKTHARWCKSYSLYQKLVVYQLTQGRLEPKLPGRLLARDRISDNINRLLADMYDEKIDMNDMQYAALTQLGTAPLTAIYSHQLYRDKMRLIENGAQKNSSFTIHVVGAELQFEADSLNKWETFFLHLRPDVEKLKVVLIGADLNPSNLPLDLLGKVKLCPTCRVDKRSIKFYFQDKQLYHEYWSSEEFLTPDIVCAFNPSINRTSAYDETWSSTINSILKLKVPFLVTAYTMNEIQRDLSTIKNCAIVDFNLVSEAKFNPFASVRPDRNFITDDEMPLLFKNYVYMVLIAAL